MHGHSLYYPQSYTIHSAYYGHKSKTNTNLYTVEYDDIPPQVSSQKLNKFIRDHQPTRGLGQRSFGRDQRMKLIRKKGKVSDHITIRVQLSQLLSLSFSRCVCAIFLVVTRHYSPSTEGSTTVHTVSVSP